MKAFKKTGNCFEKRASFVGLDVFIVSSDIDSNGKEISFRRELFSEESKRDVVNEPRTFNCSSKYINRVIIMMMKKCIS